jgi:hypothetical protein
MAENQRSSSKVLFLALRQIGPDYARIFVVADDRRQCLSRVHDVPRET